MSRLVKQAWVDEAWGKALEKTRTNNRRIGAEFPHASQGGKYVLEAPNWWTMRLLAGNALAALC